ncbi:hypothetical protein G9C98_001349 [Cotesia typhae]|uniref:Uncharacterized protein n=1 Tax=Cotesia typhae TaxID=2053667 RepID=A0A8J5QL15_9HYME|nr:hypothetical protein G9C98_001349 [Cotesia typhae]
MSLFGSLMGDIEDDPIFGMMNIFSNPFGMMAPALMGQGQSMMSQHQGGPVNNIHQMMSFGFPMPAMNMNAMFSNFMVVPKCTKHQNQCELVQMASKKPKNQSLTPEPAPKRWPLVTISGKELTSSRRRKICRIRQARPRVSDSQAAIDYSPHRRHHRRERQLALTDGTPSASQNDSTETDSKPKATETSGRRKHEDDNEDEEEEDNNKKKRHLSTSDD